jgi:hypothetical protein
MILIGKLMSDQVTNLLAANFEECDGKGCVQVVMRATISGTPEHYEKNKY